MRPSMLLLSHTLIQVRGFNLAQAPAESVFEVEKENSVADAFLGRKIIYNWPAVGRTVDESHHCVRIDKSVRERHTTMFK
jgi:hypothetical protein